MKYKKTPSFRGYSSALVAGVLFAAGMVGVSTDAEAATIRVSQESSAGAGDFDANVLGTISTFSTGITSSAFYQYNIGDGASYNGQNIGGPAPISDTTINFFVITSDGLTFYNVHDEPRDGDGGSVRMSWSLAGGDTAAFMVGDDGGEGLVPGIGVQATSFTTRHRWVSCCTDGFGLGTIDGSGWALFGEFDTNDVLGGGDIDFWTALSADGGTISLSLDLDRRVRFDMASIIDIKPGSDPNGVNPRSKGVIPVAVLGSASFDATQVDSSTVMFGPDDASPVHDGHVEDVNGDGFNDMVFHFKVSDTGIACGDTDATLTGETFGGDSITASDAVKTAGCK